MALPGSNTISTRQGAPEVKKGDVFHVKSTQYKVLDFIGEGIFGRIAKCIDLTTREIVAIKIYKSSCNFKTKIRELMVLDAIKSFDPEKKNLVRFIKSLTIRKNSYLVFEMLDRSLSALMRERKKKPLRLNEIRPITHQLLVALDALKSIGILHTDVKPDNIMLVNHKDLPFRVKLIDFGNGIPMTKVELGMRMQPPGFRAPEVTLGLPISEAVDMWGLGCVLAFLYFGFSLFPGSCYHRMKVICQLLGQPSDEQLDVALNTNLYFSKQKYYMPRWRLLLPEEYHKLTDTDPKVGSMTLDGFNSLEVAVTLFNKTDDPLEQEDKAEFLSLLKWMLQGDSERRVSPSEALVHPYITVTHLAKYSAPCPYLEEAINLMAVIPVDDASSSDDHSSVESASGRSLGISEKHGAVDRDKNSSPARTSHGRDEGLDPDPTLKESAAVSGDAVMISGGFSQHTFDIHIGTDTRLLNMPLPKLSAPPGSVAGQSRTDSDPEVTLRDTARKNLLEKTSKLFQKIRISDGNNSVP